MCQMRRFCDDPDSCSVIMKRVAIFPCDKRRSDGDCRVPRVAVTYRSATQMIGRVIHEAGGDLPVRQAAR